MDRTDRNILILGILVLVLLAVAYYFLLLSPLRQQYLDASAERTQKEGQLAQLEQQVAELENVRRNAPEIERQILEYSKRLPEQDEIPTLVVQIEQVAEGAGVTQLSIVPESPTAPQNGGDFSVIPITMSFEGTYTDMQEFITGVRNLARLVTINELTYEEVEAAAGGTTADAASAAGDEDLLTVEIVAETYVQPAGGGAPGASPDAPAGGGTTAPAAGGTTGAAGGGTT